MTLIRSERLADRERIGKIVTAAFGRAEEAALVESLRREADPALSLVAEVAGEVQGHGSSHPWNSRDHRRVCGAGLAPLSVAPDLQGRGIGSELVTRGLAACRQLGFEAVFLVGNPRYYARFGFDLAQPRGFTYGDASCDPVLQVCELVPGVLKGCSGRVRFHAAFAETGTG
jgi:putative acetyltransferase